MPSIQITGAAPEAPKPTSKIGAYNQQNQPANFLRGSERDIRSSARGVLKRQASWDAAYERASRDDWAWDRQAEIRRRRQFDTDLRNEERATTKWARLHEQAEREDFRWQQRQTKAKQNTLDKFNRALTNRYSQVAARLSPATGYSSGGGGSSMGGGGRGGGSAGRLGGRMGGWAAGRLAGHFGLGGMGDLAIGEEGLAGLGLLGPLGIGAGIAAGAAMGAYEFPGMYGSAVNSKVQGAQKYWQMQRDAAQMARAGGGAFSAGDYTSQFYTGGKPPSWMAQYGYGPGDLYGMAQGAGLPPLSPSQLRGFGTSVGAAKYSQYLGDVDSKTVASTLGLLSRLPAYSDQSKNYGSGDQTNGGYLNSALRKWQGILGVGVREGIDTSTMTQNLAGFIQAASGNGGAGVNAGNAANFLKDMTAGGLGSMRDGSGIQSAQTAATNFGNSAGAGGNPIATMAINNEINRRGGLKGITSIAALGKVMGFDPSTLSPAERYEAQQAVAAAKAGDQYSFASLVSPFVASNPQFAFQAATDWAKTSGLPAYRQSMIVGAMLGGSTSAQSLGLNASWQTRNSGPAMPKTTLGWSDIKDSQRAWIAKYAAANGIDPRRLAATLEQESGFNANATNMSGAGAGAWGMGQTRSPALADVQANFPGEKNTTLQDLLDPQTSTRVTAEYIGLLTKRWGSPSAAAAHYYGSTDPSANAAYAQINNQLTAGFTGPTTSEKNANKAQAVVSQIQTLKSGQDAGLANALVGGPIGAVAQALTGDINTINSFGDALQAVTNILRQITAPQHLGGTPHNGGKLSFPGSGYNQAPGVVIYNHRPGPQQP